MKSIFEAAQVVVDEAVGTPDGVLVPLWALDQLAQVVDETDAAAPSAPAENYESGQVAR